MIKDRLGYQKMQIGYLYLGFLLCGVLQRSKQWVICLIKLRRRCNVGRKNTFLCRERGLIKATIRVISVNAMALFNLPKDLLVSIEVMIHKFWWNGINDSHKIHWISWGKLTRTKQFRGLGFRGMEYFNQAMLAKLAWRVLTNQQALWVQIHKQKNFEHLEFLTTTPPPQSDSWSWKSL